MATRPSTLRLDLRRAQGGGQLRLGLLADGAKCRRVVHGEVGEDLAVDLDAGLVQPVDHAAVGQAVHAGRGVDARDPQRAEVALLARGRGRRTGRP